MKKSLLLIARATDLSIPLFFAKSVREKINIDVCFVFESKDIIAQKLQSQRYDFIYIRDPFGGIFEDRYVKSKMEIVLQNVGESILVDGIQSVDDIFLEDKWKQYEMFGELMPKTELPTDVSQFKKGKHMIKERISSRAQGIYFDVDAIDTNNMSQYIIQERIAIVKEYRVYVLFGEVIQQASVKSPKTENSSVKVIDFIEISDELKRYTEKVIQKNPFDFIGLDIAETQNGFYLIELNRSPLFNSFLRETGINLAEECIKKLLTEKE
jgi:hypothetical protein